MIRRRPLCFVCIILLVLLYLYKVFLYKEQVFPDVSGRKTIEVVGTVVDKEIKKGNKVIYLKDITFCDDSISQLKQSNNDHLSKGVICYLEDETMPLIGTLVKVCGQPGSFSVATNMGEFDMKKYYNSLGYALPIYKCSVRGKSKEYSVIKESLYVIKMKICAVIDNIYSYNPLNIISEESADTMKAMLVGEKQQISSDIKDLYKKAGISHILAISGLHVSLIGTAIYKMLKKILCPPKVACTISLTAIIFYGLMIGMGTSTLRAVIMFVLMMAAEINLRTYDLPTSLAVAAVLIVGGNINAFDQSGFILSFMAVTGIGIFAKYMTFTEEWDNDMMRIPINNCLTTLAVSVFTLPVILHTYYEYPLYSVFINILILPLMTALIMLGLLSVIVAVIWMPAGCIIGVPCGVILLFYEKVCNFCVSLPSHNLVMGKPYWWEIVIFYISCFANFIIAKKREKKKVEYECTLSMISQGRCNRKVKEIGRERLYLRYLIILFAVIVLTIRFNNLRISILDVGQGDGINISYKNWNVMVDGGSSTKKELSKYTLIPFLKSKGIHKIDYWLVSHPDADHISGLVEILASPRTDIEVRTIVLPDGENIKTESEELITLAKSRSIPVVYVSAGDKIKIDDMSILFIGPAKGKKYDDINSFSQVFILEKGSFKMLFTGDATKKSEMDYISYCNDNRIDLSDVTAFKVAHHGSNTSSSESLIELISGKSHINNAHERDVISIISCGKNNRYGHPHSEVMERLNNKNFLIERTDISGEIDIFPGANRVDVKRFLE